MPTQNGVTVLGGACGTHGREFARTALVRGGWGGRIPGAGWWPHCRTWDGGWRSLALAGNSRDTTGSASKATPSQGVAPREGSAAGDGGQVRGFGSDAPAVLLLKPLTSTPPLEVSGGCTCGGVTPGPRGGALRVRKGGARAGHKLGPPPPPPPPPPPRGLFPPIPRGVH